VALTRHFTKLPQTHNRIVILHRDIRPLLSITRGPHLIVIYNPAAGLRRALLLWRVLDVLAANGVRFSLAETAHPGHAADLAEAACAGAPSLIVAAGGDGTIAEVAAGLARVSGRRPALGIIPIGTANVLAQELSLSFAPRAVAAALAFRRTQTLWPGIAKNADGERLFVQMLGVGLDAQVVHHLPLGLKRWLGKTAYIAQTLREMPRYAYPVISASLDGEAITTSSLIVCKGELYAGPFRLALGARPDRPGFTVAMFNHSGPLAALLYGAALPLNLLPYAPGLKLQRAMTIEISGGAIPAQADGDPAGNAPMSIADSTSPLEIVIG
jgi:diacylglycerol kinase family enzyme